jgi:hypothetical protein
MVSYGEKLNFWNLNTGLTLTFFHRDVKSVNHNHGIILSMDHSSEQGNFQNVI